MHRPLPLCWQLKYSGSKAEKDTFTSIIVEAPLSAQNNKVTHTGQEIDYFLQTDRSYDTRLYYVTCWRMHRTFRTSPTRHFVVGFIVFCHMILCNKRNCVRFVFFCFVGFLFARCFRIMFLFYFSYHYSPVKIKVKCYYLSKSF